jgi:hypothetical protein
MYDKENVDATQMRRQLIVCTAWLGQVVGAIPAEIKDAGYI